MANKMLVDASHPEETRVVVVRGSKVEEFDFESANRKQLRGNIYLAKVTRVEPSLQAAFVDYGGNRHGFLAFSEIHPDYYQIPVADRQALIEAEERENAEADDNGDNGDGETADAAAAEASTAETTEEAPDAAAAGDGESPDPAAGDEPTGDGADTGDEELDGPEASESVESVGAEDALEEVPERRRSRPRRYKIQEVIKRRQIMLVQVVKEERGNKGAALTTYLSLAGRYAVLMPNTARGGGISRKITNVTDRKRLKQVVSDLDMPEGMGVILRTAGAARTKAEVKRDFEYLLRLWESVRELTLTSSAPTMVYEEGSLIKRSIRDLYNKDIDEVMVAGEAAYREAKDFMRMLMPSHAKNVKLYKDNQPLLAGSGVEAQLDAMFSPQVTLKSGGYIVINQTEALVSIDVNSGRSTREHNIEDTALQTNLEAADEVARQLRLRDLAGLVVIDFIDMDEKRNNRAVERRLKDALKRDRARIQVGRISAFGLLEMSRQRLRTGVLESTTTVCETCQGTGYVRAPSSVALHLLRSLEDHLLKDRGHHLMVRTRSAVALYVLNQKRAHLSELESRFGLAITVDADEAIADGSHFSIERGGAVVDQAATTASVQPDSVAPEVDAEEADEERSDGGRRRRRRRRRRGSDGAQATEAGTETAEASEAGDAPPDGDSPEPEAVVSAESDPAEAKEDGEESETAPRRRRRGRRGGRRSRRGGSQRDGAETAETEAAAQPSETEAAATTDGDEAFNGHPAADESPADVPDLTTPVADLVAEPDDAPEPVLSDGAGQPEAEVSEPEPSPSLEPESEPQDEVEPDETAAGAEPKQRRSGWWQRRSFF